MSNNRIDYPCPYLIKVIASQVEEFPQEIIEFIESKTTVYHTNLVQSKNNNYISLTVNFLLESEQMIQELFDNIKARPYVKLVL